ncbi:MAG: UTP--glucose-1-phosphate uridylyltransferase, partial [Actinomycetota bacterium]
MSENPLIRVIVSDEAAVRNQPLDALVRTATLEELLAHCSALDDFRRNCSNLYQRVRALLFLYDLHRFHLPTRLPAARQSTLPAAGHEHLLNRRFEAAIDTFLATMEQEGPSDLVSSALASAYHSLGFQTLAGLVRRSVRSERGNQWMFRIGHPFDHPLRLRPELLAPDACGGYPILCERTPVRMDLTHSAWSDIFFLGMDFPEGARALNVSIDLGVHGRDAAPQPPVEAYLRVIDRPVLRLVSVDLDCAAELTTVSEVFDFARDHLGLLKAAVIASGIVPPGLEGSEQPMSAVLERLVGPGLGLEVVSKVNDIPKGSRLAVSTNLLAGLIGVCMRATHQTQRLEGGLDEDERRMVAARAILGEWLGGSGGGWQDSGGVWPGIKLITGAAALPGDVEYGVSRGRLLPQHSILDHQAVSDETRRKLSDSLVLVHGGMAQNVGPILEMVSEKYLLRSEREWEARQSALDVLDAIVSALETGDIREIGRSTTHNFFGPIQTIVPWATNLYTERLIERTSAHFGDDFWGFWMLGGMSGGGMGFIVAPERKAEAQGFLQETMRAAKAELETALPFAMEPLVYDFAINERGTWCEQLAGAEALMPAQYYGMMVPDWVRQDVRSLTPQVRSELERFGAACRERPEMARTVDTVLHRLIPQGGGQESASPNLSEVLAELGFDYEQHEQIREAMRAGRIGLAQNRLPVNAQITDVRPEDVVDARDGVPAECRALGEAALSRGEVAVVTLAAGVGSRWTQGAGVVKALHPFCKIAGAHRTFLETHLAKSRHAGTLAGTPVPHLVTTSWLTHDAIAEHLAREQSRYAGDVLLSPGRAVGLRFVPMVRDLRFAWEETAQQQLDEQRQKMRESGQAALIGWAAAAGEGSDYTDNHPAQCLHPAGHW